MSQVPIQESELSQRDRELRSQLLAGLARGGHIAIYHYVNEVSWRGRTRRELVAVVKQKNDVRTLILWGCPLGSPPAHEAGASFLGDYEKVLASLETRKWSDAGKRAIREFIEKADREAEEEAAPKRRRGKGRRS